MVSRTEPFDRGTASDAVPRYRCSCEGVASSSITCRPVRRRTSSATLIPSGSDSAMVIVRSLTSTGSTSRDRKKAAGSTSIAAGLKAQPSRSTSWSPKFLAKNRHSVPSSITPSDSSTSPSLRPGLRFCSSSARSRSACPMAPSPTSSSPSLMCRLPSLLTVGRGGSCTCTLEAKKKNSR